MVNAKNVWVVVLRCTLLLLTACGEVGGENGITETVKAPESMRELTGKTIVFYNVENLFDTKDDPRTHDEDFTPFGHKLWSEERYKTKLERLEDAITRIPGAPLLIGLAEVENRKVLEDLMDEGGLDAIEYGIVHYDSPDRRGIDCALLYDKEHVTIKFSTTYSVRLDGNQRFTTRDILYAHVEFGGASSHIFVNHWSSRREGKTETEHKRIEAAETLREKINAILNQNAQANIVVLGDFNDYPNDKSLEEILRAKASGFAREGDLINLLYDDHEDDKGTAVYNNDWGVLDQIIVSQSVYDHSAGFGIEGRDAFILKDRDLLYTYPDGRQKPNATYGGLKYYGGYSDHLPVYIVLK